MKQPHIITDDELQELRSTRFTALVAGSANNRLSVSVLNDELLYALEDMTHKITFFYPTLDEAVKAYNVL